MNKIRIRQAVPLMLMLFSLTISSISVAGMEVKPARLYDLQLCTLSPTAGGGWHQISAHEADYGLCCNPDDTECVTCLRRNGLCAIYIDPQGLSDQYLQHLFDESFKPKEPTPPDLTAVSPVLDAGSLSEQNAIPTTPVKTPGNGLLVVPKVQETYKLTTSPDVQTNTSPMKISPRALTPIDSSLNSGQLATKPPTASTATKALNPRLNTGNLPQQDAIRMTPAKTPKNELIVAPNVQNTQMLKVSPDAQIKISPMKVSPRVEEPTDP